MGCLPDGIVPGLAALVVGGGDGEVGDVDVAVVLVAFVVSCEAGDFGCDMGGVALLLRGARDFGRLALVAFALYAFVGISVSTCSGRTLFAAAAHLAGVGFALQCVCCSHLVVGFGARPVRNELVIPMSVQTLGQRHPQLGAHLDTPRNKNLVMSRGNRCYSP